MGGQEKAASKAKGRHSRRKVDLTGQRYGRLTVLEPAENINNRTAWLCRCDCGNEVVEKTVHLRAGRVKSCGCIGAPGIGKYLTYIDGTCVEMLQAKTIRRNNTSGVPGVDWRTEKQRWRASICFQGKRYYLGSYIHFEDAVEARKKAEAEFHDKFLNEYAREHPPSLSAAEAEEARMNCTNGKPLEMAGRKARG